MAERFDLSRHIAYFSRFVLGLVLAGTLAGSLSAATIVYFEPNSVGIGFVSWEWVYSGPEVSGFKIYGSTSTAGPWGVVADTATLSSGLRKFTETNLPSGQDHYRYLAAVHPDGSESASSIVATRVVTAGAGALVRWTGAGTTPFASEAANWDTGNIPGEDSVVVMDAVGAAKEMQWNIVTHMRELYISWGRVRVISPSARFNNKINLGVDGVLRLQNSDTMVGLWQQVGGYFAAGNSTVTIIGQARLPESMRVMDPFNNLCIYGKVDNGVPDILVNGNLTVGAIGLTGFSRITVNGSASLSGSLRLNRPVSIARSLVIDGGPFTFSSSLSVGKDLNINGGGVNLTGADVGGDFWMAGSISPSGTVAVRGVMRNRGFYAMGGGRLLVGNGIELGGTFRQSSRSEITRFSTDTAHYPFSVLEGASIVLFGTVSWADHEGIRVLGPPADLTVNALTIVDLPPGATAINFQYPSTDANLTIANVDFADASLGTNVAVSSWAATAHLAVNGFGGPAAGPRFANDPNGVIAWNLNASSITGVTVSMGSATARVVWDSGAPASTAFDVRVATGPPPNAFESAQSSRTMARSASFWGLLPNTTYHFDVSMDGMNRVRFSSHTLAAPPGRPFLRAISPGAVELAWEGGGNPLGTRFDIRRSTGGDFFTERVGVSSGIVLAADLSGAATVQFQVVAFNVAGAPSDPGPASSVFEIPRIPAIASGSALGVSSIAWTWALTPNTSYYLVSSTGPSPVLLATVSSGVFTQTGLSPNLPYRIRTAGGNDVGIGLPAQNSATAYTLAAPPNLLAVQSLHLTSATLTWSLGPNPAGTRSAVDRSTDGVYYSREFLGQATSFQLTGLLPLTSYYLRVTCLNQAGAPSTPAEMLFPGTGCPGGPPSSGDAGVIPASPAHLSARSQPPGRIQLLWDASPSPGVSAYRVYWDSGTGSINYAEAFAIVAGTQNFYTSEVLPSSAAYRFAVRTVSFCGIEDVGANIFAAAPSIFAFPLARAVIRTPPPGRRVAGNRVLIVADSVQEGGAAVASVMFQFKPSSSNAWSDIRPAATDDINPDMSLPFGLTWDTDALPEGAYDLRSVARDSSGQLDPAATVLTVHVDRAAAEIIEKRLAGGRIEKRQALDNSMSNAAEAATEGGLSARVQIPAGALDASSVSLRMVHNPAAVPETPSGLASAGLSLELELSNGQHTLTSGRKALLVFAYPDSDSNGIVDGTDIRVDRLRIFSHPGTPGGSWTEGSGAMLDRSSKTVSAETGHFSVFSVFATAASGLGAIRVYPVPFKPGAGNADEGVDYSPGNLNSGIIFDSLPSGAEITIYSLLGRRVAKLSAGSSSRIQWDVKTGSGAEAPSGLYVAVVDIPGQGRITRKLLVIR